MNTIVHDQSYDTDVDRLRETIASEMEEGARKLREKGEFVLYLGGTVRAHLDFNGDNAGVTIEA